MKKVKLNKVETNRYRQRLLKISMPLNQRCNTLAEEALRPVGDGETGNLSHTPFHLADLGTEQAELDVAITLLANEGQTQAEVNVALDRLDKGTFGICEECHQPITPERLEALLFTRYGISCASKNERQKTTTVSITRTMTYAPR